MKEEGRALVEGPLGGPTEAPQRAGLPSGTRASARTGFTILELQLSLAVLVTGLFSMVWLLSVQGKQMTRAETWCRNQPTYYLLSQSNRWMRKLEASAEVKTQAGEEPWRPPVTGAQEYELVADPPEIDLDNQTILIRVELRTVGG